MLFGGGGGGGALVTTGATDPAEAEGAEVAAGSSATIGKADHSSCCLHSCCNFIRSKLFSFTEELSAPVAFAMAITLSSYTAITREQHAGGIMNIRRSQQSKIYTKFS